MDDFANAMRIVHWGKPTGVYAENPCMLVDRWAAGCDQVFQMVEHKKRGIHKKPCYVKGQDLLVPTTVSESPANTRFVNVSLKVPLKYLITFGGGINKTHLTNPDLPEIDAGYSFGVRQTFARLYHRHPEIKIFWGFTADFWLEAAASEFCFAPAGWGWGSRVKGGITSGCIPVIVQDGIKVDWEDDLPMHEFAVRMPLSHLHRLPEILNRFKRTGKAAAMRKNLECIWPLYWWSRPLGRAFEMSMCVLKARILGHPIRVDFDSCRLFCGDDQPVDFRGPFHSV